MSNVGKQAMFWIDYCLPQEQVTRLVIAKLWSRSSITVNGCWEWHGPMMPSGYCETSYRGKNWRIHRLSFTLHKGPVPNGLGVCHRCDNTRCWNPGHLWAGTQKDNSQDIVAKGRNRNASQTHCPRGHSYADQAYVDPRGWRTCRVCQRARERIRAGWPEDLAYLMEPVPHGARPINANYGRIPQPRKLKTHCNQGHALSGENLYVTPEGRRHCRECRLAHVIKYGRRMGASTSTEVRT